MTFPKIDVEWRDRTLAALVGGKRDKPWRVILDTDTYNEIDDQFALVHLLLAPERVTLEAIYAAPFYNSRSSGPEEGMELSYDEILRVLELFGRPYSGKVLKGSRAFLDNVREPVPSPAADDLIARAMASTPDDPLIVVAIGAITNVASALLMKPEIANRFVLVWLGGHALHWPDAADFNLKQDPEAARIVLDSGMPLVLVPCFGVMTHLHSTVPEIDAYVAPHGELGAFLAKRFREYGDGSAGWSKEIWDLAGTAVVIDPTWLTLVTIPTPGLSSSLLWTHADGRYPMVYARHLSRDAILSDFFKRLAAHKPA